MRHRSADDRHGHDVDGRDGRRHNGADRRHHRHHHQDPTELQKQVLQLKRLIRAQNQVIIGLSSCFVLVIISTLVLIQHLPYPNDDRAPFWERRHNEHEHLGEQLDRPEAGFQRPKSNPVSQSRSIVRTPINCTRYGCTLRPVEVSHLGNTTHAHIASSNHIMLTHKSNRKKPAPVNQDRAVLIPVFGYDGSRNEITDADPRDDFFVGLFDGHDDRGHDIAQFASEEIPSRIADRMRDASLEMKLYPTVQERRMRDIISQTFVGVDNDVPETGGGCTAHIMLRIGSRLHTANTGDSTMFVGVYTPPSRYDGEKGKRNEKYVSSPRSPDVQLHLQGTVTIRHQNKKHKANFPEEKARIESLGGKVHVPPKNPNGSRVVVRSALHGEDVGLAMSRSIGDWEWTAVGVIPDPDVEVFDLRDFWAENSISGTGSKVFVVLGSDGLFDARRAEFVAAHLAYGLFERRLGDGTKDEDEAVLSERLVEVGKKLVSMASPLKEEWYRDDITFVAKAVEL